MRALRLFFLAAALAGAGCFIGAGNFAGKGCESNNDCPAPYVCAQVRGSGRSCELVHRIDIAPAGMNALAPDYCIDVKPILDRTCVSNCHGADHSGAVGHNFRLDKYTDPMFGGAFEKAISVKNRVTADDMPPSGPANPRPTSAERALVIRWVNTGATFCNDAGPVMPDAGPGDGGAADGGKSDGGASDGGTADGGDGG